MYKRALCIGFSLFIIVVLSINLAAAHGDPLPVTIRFAAAVGSKPAACGMQYSELGASAAPAVINDYRFFVSNVRMTTADGEEVAVDLAQDGLWQYENVALLDFEDGTAGCAEAGNPEMNNKVVGEIHGGEYTGLVFDVGVPFELNHLDTTTAPAPLNIPAMWWNWQFGYKFVRVDLGTPEGPLPAWFIHLGSTGCEAADTTTAPEKPCANPNTFTVRFDTFNPASDFVVADLAALLAGVDLNENTPEPPGCMSMPMDPDCKVLFGNFGLSVEMGMAMDDHVQKFFRIG